MRSEELRSLLTSIEVAAEVVEAIDNPRLQAGKGWDLSGWRYSMVLWGVRFAYLDPPEEIVIRIEVLPNRLPNGGQGGKSR